MCLEAISFLTILLASLVACCVFFRISKSVSRAWAGEREMMEHIRECLRNGDVESATDCCRTTDTPFSRILERGLSRAELSEADIQAALDSSESLETAKLRNGISILTTLSCAVLILGFFGVVVEFLEYSLYGVRPLVGLLVLGEGLLAGLLVMLAGNHLAYHIDKVAIRMKENSIVLVDLLNELRRK